MDFLPDKEFNEIFNRVSRKVNLKDAGTPAEIHRRLHRKIKEYENEYWIDPFSQLRAENEIANMRTLIFSGFGRRAIDEAVANPEGIVALTLKYGRKKARKIWLTRKKKTWR